MEIIYIANVRMPTEKAHGLQIAKMCEAWGANGHSVMLLAPKRFNHIKTDPFVFYGVRKNFGIKKIFTLDFLRLSNKKWAFWAENISFAWCAAWSAAGKNADIIFCRDFWSAYFLSLLGKKVIYEVHDSPPQNRIISHAFKKINKFISTNQYKAKELADIFDVQKEKILVTPNGVDQSLFLNIGSKDLCRVRVGLPQDKKIILYAGHLYSWKGADVLLEAAKTLKREDVVIVFIGGTPEDVGRFRLQAGDRNNVMILGHQEYQKIPYYLAGADILVLPNTGRENISLKETSPIKLFEYMAAGRPIIASNIPSIREIVSEKEAVFFEPDNPDDLKNKIEKVLDNYCEYLPLAENAKKIAGQYSWDGRACGIIDFAGGVGRKKVLFIAGARPNFVKLAAIFKVAPLWKSKLDINLIHTGQHYSDELSKIFFEEFNMPEPIANLGVGSGSRAGQIGKICSGLSEVFLKNRPDLVAVVGDVNSTVAAAIEAVRHGIPVAHIEAGLRSFNWQMPEELNRVMTDHLSELLFASEESALENLKNEKNSPEKIHFVGNVMIDTLLSFLEKSQYSNVLENNNLRAGEFALATLHRAENVDNPGRLKELFGALEEIANGIEVVLPLHPRTKTALEAVAIVPRLKILPPQPYFDFLKLQKEAKFILTDSGGIQEEASILKVPCITIRTETERPITVTHGTNEVIGVEREKIVEAAKRAAAGDWKNGGDIPLWDGKAAERILKIIAEYLGA